MRKVLLLVTLAAVLILTHCTLSTTTATSTIAAPTIDYKGTPNGEPNIPGGLKGYFVNETNNLSVWLTIKGPSNLNSVNASHRLDPHETWYVTIPGGYYDITYAYYNYYYSMRYISQTRECVCIHRYDDCGDYDWIWHVRP